MYNIPPKQLGFFHRITERLGHSVRCKMKNLHSRENNPVLSKYEAICADAFSIFIYLFKVSV